MNVLFVQDSSPCIRNIKYAEALSESGINIHLAHRGINSTSIYGMGNEFYSSISKLHRSNHVALNQLISLINEKEINLLHYHNYPDKLGAQFIRKNFRLPFVYDQHDFMSMKKNFSITTRYYEKQCNEKNNGAIYVSENYRSLVAQKYKVNPLNLIVPNYGSKSSIVNTDFSLPLIDTLKSSIHLVYIGHITEHSEYVRYMVDYFRLLSNRGFYIHIYPMRNKDYIVYSHIPRVIVHKTLPLKELLVTISQYHYGIAFLNQNVRSIRRRTEVKYGFWNKMVDYMMAGIPFLTFEYFEDMSKYTQKYDIGLVFNSINVLTHENISKIDYNQLRRNVISVREKMTFSYHVAEIESFYKSVLKEFYG